MFKFFSSSKEPALAESATALNSQARAALDVVTTCAMLVDADLKITYINKAAEALMRAAQPHLRRDLPQFDAGRLIGTALDRLHPDLARQRGLLTALTATHDSRLTIGGITFRLISNPMRDAGGARIGAVVEWIDLTEQSRREAEERQRVEVQARVAAENLRIRTALDHVSGNVMLADADNNIVYVNQAVVAMFRTAAADIRRDLPAFDPDRLVGQNIDVFHRNPTHQRKVLAELHGKFTSQFKVGHRTFGFIANSVTDGNGRRLGTVVEWVDRTQEVAIEEEIQTILGAAHEGDLTRHVEEDGKEGFFRKLATGINGLLDNMAGVVQQIKVAVGDVQIGAEQISRGNADLSQRTEEQSSSLEETASSMEEMTSTVKQTADNAGQANQLAMAARQQAEKGGAVVGNAVTAMSGINAASKKIADIIGVIDEIAFQTNLLALNAAVEAARAGEQGRGFAVVATEVRNLAGRSATAAKEIKALIKDSVGKVEQGGKLVEESGETLEEIVIAVKKVTDIVAEIAAASREQSSGIEQVNKAVMQMDQTTQQNAALVEEAAAASQAIVEQTQALSALVARYKVGGETREAEIVASPPAAPARAAVPTTRVERRSSKRPWSRPKAVASGHEPEWTEF